MEKIKRLFISFGHNICMELYLNEEEEKIILDKIKYEETFLIEYTNGEKVLINGGFVQYVQTYIFEDKYGMQQNRLKIQSIR
jgi:hypothetical protein